MLAFSIADAHRALGRAKRDVARDQSLEAALNESSSKLEVLLMAQQSSPSQRAARQEQLVRLADALAQLPEDQREAVVRKHLQGDTVAAIAQSMGRSETAVGGLLCRELAPSVCLDRSRRILLGERGLPFRGRSRCRLRRDVNEPRPCTASAHAREQALDRDTVGPHRPRIIADA